MACRFPARTQGSEVNAAADLLEDVIKDAAASTPPLALADCRDSGALERVPRSILNDEVGDLSRKALINCCILRHECREKLSLACEWIQDLTFLEVLPDGQVVEEISRAYRVRESTTSKSSRRNE